MISKYRYWIPATLYMALIFWLSSRPSPEELRIIPLIARLKIVHMIEYGMLYYFVWHALRATSTYRPVEILILAFFIVVLYGLTDEFHQIFVAGRTARLIDVVADGIGGIITAFVLKLFRRTV